MKSTTSQEVLSTYTRQFYTSQYPFALLHERYPPFVACGKLPLSDNPPHGGEGEKFSFQKSKLLLTLTLLYGNIKLRAGRASNQLRSILTMLNLPARGGNKPNGD